MTERLEMNSIIRKTVEMMTIFLVLTVMVFLFMPVNRLEAWPGDESGTITIHGEYSSTTNVDITITRNDTWPSTRWAKVWETGKYWQTKRFIEFNGNDSINTSFNLSGEGTKSITVAFGHTKYVVFNNTSDSITIDTTDPVADAGGPYSGDEKQAITFDGSASSDANGIIKYEWDFGNGFQDLGPGPDHTWDDPFSGLITLRVTDASGRTGTDTADVTVNNVAPVADAGGPYSGDEGSDITFDGSSSTGQGDLTYEWDFGDGFQDLGAVFARSWSDNTSGTVTLRVTDEDGESATDDADYTVNNVAPVADAGGPYSGLTAEDISISGSASDAGADDTITQWEWDLDYDSSGFNTDVTGKDITNQWADNGTYMIALRVTDDDGAVSEPDSAEVIITNREPVSDAGGPYNVDEGSSITLDGSGSSDPDGTIAEYSWDLDGDGLYGDAAEQNPTFDASNLDGPSTVNISLLVTDDDGASASSDTTVTINNVAPSADAGGPYSVDEGSTIVLSGTGSDVCPSDSLSYSWDLDGDGLYGDAAGQNPTFDASNLDGPSTVNISLLVTDDDGASASSDTTVTINNVAPSADAGGPYEGFTFEDINLTGSGTDPCAADTFVYEWDLDYDGTVFDVDASGEEVTDQWADNGTYMIALRVTDDDGGVSGIATAEVTINNRAPSADAGGPYNGTRNSSIEFDGSDSGDMDGSIVAYSWDFGDGSPKAYDSIANHSYENMGTYIVKLTVTDDDGARSESTAVVTIIDIPATVTVAGITEEGNIDVLGLTELSYTGINPFIPLSGIAVLAGGIGIFLSGFKRKKKNKK
jgi:PKD repeat protein